MKVTVIDKRKKQKPMPKVATMPVPIAATVSRETGEIRFEYSMDGGDQVRFGRTMNWISRLAEYYMDQDAKAAMGAG